MSGDLSRAPTTYNIMNYLNCPLNLKLSNFIPLTRSKKWWCTSEVWNRLSAGDLFLVFFFSISSKQCWVLSPWEGQHHWTPVCEWCHCEDPQHWAPAWQEADPGKAFPPLGSCPSCPLRTPRCENVLNIENEANQIGICSSVASCFSGLLPK